MLDWIQNLMDSMGYAGIVLLMFLENIFPPLPSELVMPAAGFAAARGDLNLIGVVLAGTLGSVLGALPLYWLGHAVGEDRLARWADRWGKWLTVSGDEVRRADDWFDRFGHRIVLFARVVPGVRSLISIPAGISEMPILKFVLYTTLGTAVWSTIMAMLGHTLGDHYEQVERWVGPVGAVILILIALYLLFTVVRRHRKGAGAPEKQPH